MKSGFRYFCFICASLLATQMVAADMSGWSDKTVCRLVKAGEWHRLKALYLLFSQKLRIVPTFFHVL